MATTDKIPLKALFNAGKPYALSELQAGDTLSPVYTYYNSGGNTTITNTNVKGAVDQIEDNLTVLDTPSVALNYFDAYASADQSGLAIYTYNKVNINTVVVDPDSGFDIVNHTYTIPTKGIWIFTGTVTHRVDIYGNIVTLMRNGSPWTHFVGHWFNSSHSLSSPDNQGYIQSGCIIVELNVGDVMHLAYHPGNDTGVTISGGERYTNFSGYLHRKTL